MRKWLLTFTQLTFSQLRFRPLNTLTWPELLRHYIAMLEQEHSTDGLEGLSEKMELREMQVLLEEESYEDIPLASRLKLLMLNLQLALETHTMRLFVDEMCEQSAKSATQKRESFQVSESARAHARTQRTPSKSANPFW